MSAHHCCSSHAAPLWCPFKLSIGYSSPLQQRWAYHCKLQPWLQFGHIKSDSYRTIPALYIACYDALNFLPFGAPQYIIPLFWGANSCPVQKIVRGQNSAWQFIVQRPPNQHKEEGLQRSAHFSHFKHLKPSGMPYSVLPGFKMLLQSVPEVLSHVCQPSVNVSNAPGASQIFLNARGSESSVQYLSSHALTQNNDFYYLYAPFIPVVLLLAKVLHQDQSVCAKSFAQS